MKYNYNQQFELIGLLLLSVNKKGVLRIFELVIAIKM